MSQLQYTPDRDIKVHEQGAIRLICAPYQSHEDGLPEWVKNASDEYARTDAPEAKRVIVLILESGRSAVRPSIACLDFSGMSTAVLEEQFRIWADPEAATRGSATSSGVQGGHGNGGKCYMTQMFEDYATVQTVKRGVRNVYGVAANSIMFGYIPNAKQGRAIPARGLVAELDAVLKPFRLSVGSLPSQAQSALMYADGFSLVQGVGPRGYGNRVPWQSLVNSLQDHPQMARTLEFCKVLVIVNGKAINGGEPLNLPEIVPIVGAEQPRVIHIPDTLKDPDTNQDISTTQNEALPRGFLVLKTSATSMRFKRKPRHTIIYHGQSGYIGNSPVIELGVQSSFRDQIYGECHLKSLEPYKQNDRGRLARSPLTRAVEAFIGQEIEAYAREFEAKEQRRYNQTEKNELSRINDALDAWKNRFLRGLLQSLWGPTPPPPPPPPLPVGRPARIELGLSRSLAGLGVAIRPTIRFFDQSAKQIRAVPFRWVSEDPNVALVDEDLMVINTFSYGATILSATTLDGRVTSNTVPLEVVRLVDIELRPPVVELEVGGRARLEPVCTLPDGRITSDVYLVWTESNPSVVKVSPSGAVYALTPGDTEIIAGDDHTVCRTPALARVLQPSERPEREPTRHGFPRVLISDIERDPETGEEVTFSSDYPPVVQRPIDVERNVWWINSASPLARLYMDRDKGYGVGSSAWRMYHLERYIDIMVQIAFKFGLPQSDGLSADEWIFNWGEQVASIQAAAASQLGAFLTQGEIPTV